MKDTSKTREQLIQELVELRQRVAVLEADHARCKKVEKALERRLKFEETVTRVSSYFTGFLDMDSAINASLADIGTLSQASRAYLFIFRENGTIMDNTHEWCGEGVSPQIASLQALPCEMFPWWMMKLRGGETIHIIEVSMLPEEAKAEKEILEAQDIKSLLVLPLNIGGELAGFIGFDNVIETGKWTDEDLTLLRVTSEIFGRALAHHRTDERLKKHLDDLEEMVKERIAELQKSTEQIRQSEERYRTILEEIDEGYYEQDLAGNFTFVNDSMCRLLGHSREELIGMNYRVYVPAGEVKKRHEAWNKVYRTGKPLKRIPLENIKRDGTLQFVEDSVLPLRNKEGEIVGFRGVSRDVTERKRMEDEKRQLEQKAHLASRLASVGEMASGIAHEINNPLTGVIGYAHLLLARKDMPDDIRHDVEVINEGAQRVAGIVKRMLTFARQHKPERKYVNINEIIDNTFYMRAYHLESSNIKVTTRLARDLPMTIADPGQLQQMFLNLIINAETEMKLAHGKGKLSVRTEQIDNNIRILFKDDGPGIAKENLERIFDPFFTTREVGQGTGLGLSVCHGIVAEHKGRIYAESKPGRGATFIVELPIVTEPEQFELPEPEIEEPQKVAKAKILVVDDEPIIREFMSQVLNNEGHEVEAADNAEDALEMVKSKRYRLILLDIKMPGMSGIELYKHLQKITPSLARRVVFVTGDVIGTRTTAFLSKTKVPRIMKPFDAKQLRTEINRILTEGI